MDNIVEELVLKYSFPGFSRCQEKYWIYFSCGISISPVSEFLFFYSGLIGHSKSCNWRCLNEWLCACLLDFNVQVSRNFGSVWIHNAVFIILLSATCPLFRFFSWDVMNALKSAAANHGCRRVLVYKDTSIVLMFKVPDQNPFNISIHAVAIAHPEHEHKYLS